MEQPSIIDPHHHLWDLSVGKYPWLQHDFSPKLFGEYSRIRRDYLFENFWADAKSQNLVKSVHLQAEHAHDDPVSETRWVQSVADIHGFPHGIVAYADLEAPNLETTLVAHRQFKNLRGIRQIVNYHPDPVKSFVDRPDLMRSAKWQEGYGLLRKYDLSFDLQLYYPQMEDAFQVAKRFPDTQVILNHTGMPLDRSTADLEGWRKGMARLAEAPNIACKVSGLGLGDWNWTVESIRPFALYAIDTFGADRCMFASNFPVDKLFSSYDAIFDAFKAITADFSIDDRWKLFHDNANRLYRL